MKLPGKGSAELRKDGKLIASPKNDDQFLFLGLEPESTYEIKAALDSGNSLEEQEKEILLENDSVIEFMEKGHKDREAAGSDDGSKGNATSAAGFLKGNSGTSGSSSGHLLAYLLIGLINLVGIVVIAKILKKS